MVAEPRTYAVRCVFCSDRKMYYIEDAQDVDRQEVARAIIQIAAKYSTPGYPITPEDIIGPRRTYPICDARQEAMWYLRDQMGLTFKATGYFLGKRDHSTVINGVNRYKERMGA